MLEIICLILYVNGNDYAKASVFSSTNSLVGSLFQRKDNIESYLFLKDVNEQLSKENILLRNELSRIKPYVDDSIQYISRPTSNFDTSFSYISARVIKTQLYGSNNLLTLNKGSNDGIDQDMGVINAEGIVGIIIKTSPHFSLVRPIINNHGPTGTGISGMIKNSHSQGSVQWLDGSNYKKAQLLNIERANIFNIGDTVVSTGISDNFPYGIIIGTVAEAQCEKGNEFYDITLDLAVDYKNISYVEVIANELTNEKRILEGQN